jgi:hypothetical protein
LNIGVTYETFHLSGKTLVAIDLLKNAQFFKMVGTLFDIQILQNALDLILSELELAKRWVNRHVFWARIKRHPDIIGICSLYKFCKQIADFIGPEAKLKKSLKKILV